MRPALRTHAAVPRGLRPARAWLPLVLMALAGVMASSSLRAQPATGLRIGAVVTPDTVQVGDRFIMTVTVEVPAGARVTWPTPGDSNGPVSLRAPVRVTGTENGPVRRETAEYDMVVWAVGAVSVKVPDIMIRDGNRETAVPFAAPSLFVQSVLPGDTSLHQPKPAKDLFPRVIPWWELWWPVLLVLLALALVAWLVWRSRRRKRQAIEFDPFARAENDFQRLDRLALHEAGEQGRFVALALEVLRTYMSVRVPAATLALTSEELVGAVEPDSRVPLQRLAPLLVEGDAIKFGRVPVSSVHARELALEARSIVSAIEQAETARREAEKAREKAQKRAERKVSAETRAQAEEKARLESRRGKSEAA